MSTRALIAVPTAGGWVGRYVHSDGHPMSVGPDLLDTYAQLSGDLPAVIAYAIRPDEHGYWSSFHPPAQATGWQDDDDALIPDTDDVDAEWAYVIEPSHLGIWSRSSGAWQKVAVVPWVGDAYWPDWADIQARALDLEPGESPAVPRFGREES